MTDAPHDLRSDMTDRRPARPVTTIVWLRSIGYEIAYWLITTNAALICTVLALFPSRKPLAWGLQMYGSAQVAALRHIASVTVEVRGRDRLPDEPVVIGAKHQSWGDGFVMLSQIAQISFVAGDHLYKFPLVGRILKKVGAIVLSNGGGEDAQARLNDGIEALQTDGRDVLIYPEGHLSPVGEKYRYRSGVWRLYSMLNRPCTPVATSLGVGWNQQDFFKFKSHVVVEFLDPIAPGLEKDDFLALLEERVETQSNALIAEARAQ